MPCSTFPERSSAAPGGAAISRSLFVRGGESNYNKVLVDGVPVNDPGGIFDFGVVPMNNVDRLEVERGPESTVYGSDAMTSVVQLWTATGSTRTPEIQFGADGGNFSTANGYASLAGARGIFDYNVFANQFNTQGQGVNDAYSNSLQGGNVGVRHLRSRGISPARPPLQQLDRHSVELVVQRQSRASARSEPVRAPEQLPRQRRSHGQRAGRLAAPVQRLRVPPRRA